MNGSLQSFNAEPTSSSALIAAADAGHAPANDFHGLSRGGGGGPDIGAIEYGTEAAPVEPDPEPLLSSGFTYQCQGLSCQLSASMDNRSELAYEWSLGDGNASTSNIVEHVYPAGGTYIVQLKVTDTSSGLSSTTSDTLSVSGQALDQPTIKLNAKAFQRPNGKRFVRLRWSGISTDITDIYRDGVLIASTFSYHLYSDRRESDDPDQMTYQVCQSGQQSCSESVLVNF
ncbi:MAG: PKD domain-containing protein [Xanthomonadaceae bacterium]|nr:PKD domain-containing protein [Xanthomonadaceae bacterium]